MDAKVEHTPHPFDAATRVDFESGRCSRATC